MTQAPAWVDALDPGEARRSAARLIRRHVRGRFALSLEALAERVLEVARAAFPDGPWPECAVRLSLDDLYLATACARGEEPAWEECAARHFSFIRDFARRRLPPTLAEDLAGDVIADLWMRGKIAQFEGRSTLRTWLGAIVAHAAVNAAKAERTRASLASDRGSARPQVLESPENSVIETQAAGMLSGFLRRAITTVSDEERLLLFLYYEQDLTLEQIAALSRTSKSTLSRRLSRLRDELRAAVESLAARHGVPGAELRASVELVRLELELGSLLRRPQSVGGGGAALSKPVKGGAA